MKKTISFVLSFLLLLQFSGVAYASSLQPYIDANNDVINTSKTNVAEDMFASNDLYLKLCELGFSEDEILLLYQNEANRLGTSLLLPSQFTQKVAKTVVFPSKGQLSLNNYDLLRVKDGDKRHFTVSVNFRKVADFLGYTGTGMSIVAFLKAKGERAFTKALISTAGLSFVSIVISVAGEVFGLLSTRWTGVTFYLTQSYAYDPYELMGKWYLVDASYRLY